MDGWSEDDTRWKRRVDRPLTLLPWWCSAAGAFDGAGREEAARGLRGRLLGCAAEQFGAAARELQQLDGCSRMAAAGGASLQLVLVAAAW